MAQLPEWITIERNPNAEWFVQGVVYLDEKEAQGDVNIYVTVLDEDGAPVSGIGVYQDWRDERAIKYTISGKVDFVQSGDSSFDPGKGQHGPYGVYVTGGSEAVWGMGLPLRRHVRYDVTFKKAGSEPPPPTPGQGLNEAQVRAIVADEMAKRTWKVVPQ